MCRHSSKKTEVIDVASASAVILDDYSKSVAFSKTRPSDTYQISDHLADTMNSLMTTTIRNRLDGRPSVVERVRRIKTSWRKLIKALRKWQGPQWHL